MPKITLTHNLGTVDMRAWGLLQGDDPADVKKALETYQKRKTVDVPKPVYEHLLKRGLGTIEAVPHAAGIKGVEEESPVSQSNADEAIASIGTMRSKDKLQHIVDNDSRVTVKEAAKKRLASL